MFNPKPEDAITYFPAGKAPRPAVFVSNGKAKVRIRLTEKDGNTRTILAMRDCIGPVVADKTPGQSIYSTGGMRG